MHDLPVLPSELINAKVAALSMLVAFVLGMLLAAVYARTYRGMSYSRNLVQALVLAALVAALLMLAIGDNLTRGLGIIGTLALIRFRTNLRDPWDVVFVFAAFAVGIASGTQAYGVALVGTLMLSAAAFLLTWSGFGGKQLHDGLLRLHLPSSREVQSQAERVIRDHCHTFVLITVRDLGAGDEQELAYQVRLRVRDGRAALVSDLGQVPGARAVSVYMQEATVEL